MLTALHITLPQRQDNHRESQQQLPNRCLVVKESTNEATLISTEASLKYSKDTSQESYETGTRFRFDHITISPHHGSIFVTQVAPLVYDLCRMFSQPACSKGTSIGAGSDVHNVSTGECRKNYQKLSSMSGTVFVYGSHSATDRRALFLHLAKATALALLQETHAMSTQTMEQNSKCKVFFSLVDLYHAWGVGDVLDTNAVMHDTLRLQRLKREEPRRSLNEPKGIDIVEPTRQLLEGRDSISTYIPRALQRTDPPRALRTDTEKEDHAVKSTLVLTFVISKHVKSRAEEEKSRQKMLSSNEAKFHLILLPDSTAASHGKQGAQELGALASGLQACAQWQNERNAAGDGDNGDSLPLRAKGVPLTDPRLDASSSSAAAVKTLTTSKVLWVPLRESPLLLYLFESNMYYRYGSEQRLRNYFLSKKQRQACSDGSRSVSANVSTQSLNDIRSVSFSTGNSTEQSGYSVAADTNIANVIDCIAAGIGKCLLIVCVNSGWDQYYQARSAFLFAQRATNQFCQPGAFLDTKAEEITLTCGPEHGKHNLQKPLSLSSSNIRIPYDHPQTREFYEPSSPLAKTVAGVERQLWSSPQRKETTEPRHPQAGEESPVSPQVPSEVTVIEDEDSSDHKEDRYELSQRMKTHVIGKCEGSSRTDGVIKITSPIASSPPADVHSYPVQQLFRCDNYDSNDLQRGIISHDEESVAKSWENPETTCNTQAAPVYSGLCESPASTRNVKLSSSQLEMGPMINDVLFKQSLLLQENKRLRALLAGLSSQQADSYREQKESVRIGDVCDAALLESRGAAKSSQLDALRRQLSTATKKARVLENTISRLVNENSKLHRLMHSQMKRCFGDISRVFEETLAKRDSNVPAIAEERIRHWEMMLEKTVRRMMQQPVRGNDRVEEEESGNEEEEEEVKSSLGNTMNSQVVQLLQLSHRLFLCESSSVNNVDEHNVLPWANVHEAPQRAEAEAHGATNRSLTKSVMDILSPRQQERCEKPSTAEEERHLSIGQRVESELCWKCKLPRRTHHNATYMEFMELLRSLCSQMKINGSNPPSVSYHQEMHGAEEEKEEKVRDKKRISLPGQGGVSSGNRHSHEKRSDIAAPVVVVAAVEELPHDERGLLSKTRQLSESMKKSTDIRVNERLTVQSLRNELEQEREWRRQLQDELLSLRHRLSKYESKFAFIDETVKSKFSKDIAALEQKISDREKQEELERQRRAVFMSQIQKRLQRVIADDMTTQATSSLTSLSPRS